MDYHLSINAQDVLCVSGKICLPNVISACNHGKEMISSLKSVRVDLAGIEQADSSTLAMLIEWVRSARMQQKEIIFLNMPQFMLDLGRVCGLDTVLPVDKPLQW